MKPLQRALCFLAIGIAALSCSKPERVLVCDNLRVEHRSNPLGIDNVQPRISWQLISSERAKIQTAYQILVAKSTEDLHNESDLVWNSTKHISDETNGIKYSGEPLVSGQKYFWKVRVWDESGLGSDWSEVQFWSMGMLKETDWRASWIGVEAKPKGSVPMLSTTFSLEKPIESAMIYSTAKGNYEMQLGGERVGKDYFTPGWSDYRHRLYYNTYDVTDLLSQGENVWSCLLADGWYAGNVSDKGRGFYGEQSQFKAQLIVNYADHTTDTFGTNSTWKWHESPIVSADLLNGEKYDARLIKSAISTLSVKIYGNDSNPLQSYPIEPVRVQSKIESVASFALSNGNRAFDFGQNFAGIVRLRAKGASGSQIVLKYAETLSADSALYYQNLRGAKSSDTLIFGEKGTITWQPKFTYHGFRYVEIITGSDPIDIEELIGLVLHSEFTNYGSFRCSNGLINHLHQNLLWSMKSNFVEIPTDCPQRDERLGWAADANLFLHTAAYNADVFGFYDKWLDALRDGQFKSGRVPSTAPAVHLRIASGWGDAIVLTPMKLFNVYGDTSILRQNYAAMKNWINYLVHRNFAKKDTQISFGDWQNLNAQTTVPTVSLAYLVKSANAISQIAFLLDRTEDAAKFREVANHAAEVFVLHRISDYNTLVDSSQTSCLLALAFDLVPDSIKPTVQNQLIELIVENDYKLTTGILGTQLLLPVLTEIGEVELAYKLLLNTDMPSWGYQVENGATTIWEKWDSYSLENGMNPDPNNSLNHYALGSVGEWFYSTIAGIRPASPGFKSIEIKPHIGGGLTYAKADYNSIRGTIRSHWRIDNDSIEMKVEIPPNTTAEVHIPSAHMNQITESGLNLQDAKGVISAKKIFKSSVIQIVSGSYSFRAPLR